MTRVTAVIPCRNNPDQVRTVVESLAAVDAQGLSLRAVLVDDASDPPLVFPNRTDALDLQGVRLADNRGGSGAFNEGIRAALSGREQPDFVWLLDSDAAASRGALRPLVAALHDDERAIAACSALRDPTCGHAYEAGGRIGRWSGVATPDAPTTRRTVEYAAACSLLVRSDALRRAGLLPEVFLSHDDIIWCLEASRRLGGHVLAVPESVVDHPWQRVHAAGRYYASRNCWQALSRRGLATRAGRALIELLLALSAAMEFGPEFAGLHVAGWRDAAGGRTRGRCTLPIPPVPETMPLDEARRILAGLGAAACRVHPHLSPMAAKLGLDRVDAATGRGGPAGWTVSDLLATARRALVGPVEGCVVAPAAWPFAWASRRVVLHPTDGGAIMLSPAPGAGLGRAIGIILRGVPHLGRLVATGGRTPSLPGLLTDHPARMRAGTP